MSTGNMDKYLVKDLTDFQATKQRIEKENTCDMSFALHSKQVPKSYPAVLLCYYINVRGSSDYIVADFVYLDDFRCAEQMEYLFKIAGRFCSPALEDQEFTFLEGANFVFAPNER